MHGCRDDAFARRGTARVPQASPPRRRRLLRMVRISLGSPQSDADQNDQARAHAWFSQGACPSSRLPGQAHAEDKRAFHPGARAGPSHGRAEPIDGPPSGATSTSCRGPCGLVYGGICVLCTRIQGAQPQCAVTSGMGNTTSPGHTGTNAPGAQYSKLGQQSTTKTTRTREVSSDESNLPVEARQRKRRASAKPLVLSIPSTVFDKARRFG